MKLKKLTKIQHLWFILVAVILLTGFSIGTDSDEERASLLQQEKDLKVRIEALKQDQEYLRFQKAMQTLDSKYLLLDVKGGIGQLRYKNRILKQFSFTAGKPAVRQEGIIAVTERAEGIKGRHAISFGQSLILRGKRPPSAKLDPAIPRLSLAQKDFLSVYYALEQGSQAYILR